MIKNVLHSLLLFIFPISLVGQVESWCISGRIIDHQGQPIPAAHITTLDLKNGTVSDSNGFFELCQFNGDQVQIQIGHTAFNKQLITIYASKSKNLTFTLQEKNISTQEVRISGNQSSLTDNYIPGKLTLKNKDILAIPTFMGSPDVLRSLQLLPGMQSVSEGNAGIYVRGGSPGQNYVLFDNIELMNPTHLMGVYSVFNPLLIQQVEFYKGNAPIHLSARLASSILVNTQNTKADSSNWYGNIGNILTNLAYTGQSANKKWYFNTGIRRSYLDILGHMAKPFLKDDENYFEQNNYTFYDWNGKLKYRHGKSSLMLSWYLGQDDFLMNNKKNNIESNATWGNHGAALTWNYLFKPELSWSNIISYSGYKSDFGADTEAGTMQFKTDYSQLQYKSMFTRQKEEQLLRWGLELTRYDITPQNIEVSQVENSDYRLNKYQSLAAKAYVSDQWTPNESWTLYGGLALQYYGLLNIEGEVADENYSKPQIIPNATFSLSYHPNQTASYKGSYTYSTQNIHLASIASIPLPSDIWMPATNKLPLEKGHQLTLGYFKNITDKGMQLGLEAFGKYMDELTLLKINFNNEQIDHFDENFYLGESIAWGSEFFLQKQAANYNLTASYTLAWTRQRFPGINEDAWHDAKYDRRHDLNLQGTYILNKRIDFGAVFIYASGNKATLPTGRYWLMGDIANDYAGVNNYRMPAYHRLDVSMNYKLRSNVFHESMLNFSIINLYSRSNPYFIYYHFDKGNKDYELSIKAKQVSLFPIMPSISWRFKF